MEPKVYETLEILHAVEQVPVKSFIRDVWFTKRKGALNEHIAVLQKEGDGGLAPFVSHRIHGKVVEQKGYRVVMVTPELLAPVLELDPKEQLAVPRGLSVSVNELINQAKLTNARDLDARISRREEAMCAELISTGKITFQGDGVDKVIDFWEGLSSADKPYADIGAVDPTAYWSSSTADILGDLEATRIKMSDKGHSSDIAIVSSKVLSAIRSNADIRALLDNKSGSFGHLDSELRSTGALYAGNLAGLDLYCYSVSGVDRTSARDETYASKKFLADNLCIIGSSDYKADLIYGLFAKNGSSISNSAREYDEYDIQAGSPILAQRMRSAPLPIVEHLNAFQVLKVLAS